MTPWVQIRPSHLYSGWLQGGFLLWVHNSGKLLPGSTKQTRIRGCSGTYQTALPPLCIASTSPSPPCSILSHLVSSAWCGWWSWASTLMQPLCRTSIQHNLWLMDTSPTAAQQLHVLFGNVSLCKSWLEDKYREEAWSVNQQGPVCPVGEVIRLTFWDSHRKAETVRENRVSGALQPPEKHMGKGSRCGCYGWKASCFPMKGRRSTGIEVNSGQPLTSVDWMFLHDRNHDRGILIPEFAHNWLLGVKEECVQRLKGIIKEFISKNCLGIKRTRQWAKDSL